MTPYDEFPYDDYPFPGTHPDWIGTIASLFGMEPAPATRCRVLELGCGRGGNLLPMAQALPGSEFVGIDLAGRALEAARADAAALGLSNCRLVPMDIRDVGPELGTFDYIVCHGVYSWVEPEVQRAILGICRGHLAPQGVAYVSYNTLPGWHARGMIRDLLRRFVPAGGPRDRVAAARRLMAFLGAHLPVERSPAARWLKAELDLIGDLSDAYVFYEHLTEHNEPLWFREFMDRAAAVGLRYVGDAEFDSMVPDRYGPEVAEWLRAEVGGQIEAEEYLDLLSTRFFRRTLLCHAEVALDRTLRCERLRGLWIAARLDPPPDLDPTAAGDAAFRAPDGYVLTTDDPLLKAALARLAHHAPKGLPLERLCAEARAAAGGQPAAGDLEALASSLLEIYAQGQLELGRWDRPYVTVAGDRPATTPLVRLRAARGEEAVTNLRHESMLVDRLDRVLLRVLDGTRDRDALVGEALAAVEAGACRVEIDGEPVRDRDTMAEVVDVKLDRFARMALLVRDDFFTGSQGAAGTEKGELSTV